MDIGTFLFISVIVALMGAVLGASMVVVEKRQTPTARPTRTARTGENATRNRPTRKQIFRPMIGLLGLSIFLLIIGYTNLNIIAFAVGYIFLFFGCGLLGSFLFNELF